MDLKPCPLCYYQRTFALALVGVLGMGVVGGVGQAGRLSLLALPVAVAGLGVAAFHVWLEATGKLECPQGLFGLGTAPKQSLAMFGLTTALLIGDASATRGLATLRWPALAGGLVLGGALALGACTSNPPMPAPPKEPYPKAADICRPPYRAPGN
jgi:disulfide bond formation protein DsbB